MFKVNDKVKRIKGIYNGMTAGCIGTVKSLDYKGSVSLEEYEGKHDSDNFELVKEGCLFKIDDTVYSENLGTTRIVIGVDDTHITLLAPNKLKLRLFKTYVAKHYKVLFRDKDTDKVSNKASDTQVGGHHYTDMGIQPFEYTYANYGYIGLKAAVHTKVNKYLGRVKDNEIEQLKKARHAIDVLIEKAEMEANK